VTQHRPDGLVAVDPVERPLPQLARLVPLLRSGVAYAVRTAVNGGSELLIFVLRGAHSDDFVVAIRRWFPWPAQNAPIEIQALDDVSYEPG
jgi:hypothetical protein